MTLTDAKKNHTAPERDCAGIIPGRDAAELSGTARTLKHHVSQLRQILDLGVLVEQDRATARVLNKLQAVIPDRSQAAVALKLGRAELRKHGMGLHEEGPNPPRRMA